MIQESNMFNYIFCFCAGLIVGWNLLPQPSWVKAIYDLVISKFKNWTGPKNQDNG